MEYAADAPQAKRRIRYVHGRAVPPIEGRRPKLVIQWALR
jgi:hypothetical protein